MKTKIQNPKLRVVQYLPHGSADAEWRVMVGGETVAIMLDDGDDGERYATLFAHSPDLAAALLSIIREADGAWRSGSATAKAAVAALKNAGILNKDGVLP